MSRRAAPKGAAPATVRRAAASHSSVESNAPQLSLVLLRTRHSSLSARRSRCCLLAATAETSCRNITAIQLDRQLIAGLFVASNKRKSNVSFHEPFKTLQKRADLSEGEGASKYAKSTFLLQYPRPLLSSLKSLRPLRRSKNPIQPLTPGLADIGKNFYYHVPDGEIFFSVTLLHPYFSTSMSFLSAFSHLMIETLTECHAH